MRRAWIATLGIGLAGLSALAGQAESPSKADLVLWRGAVIAMDEAGRTAQALAVKGGQIVYVGSSAGARAFIGPKTKVVDLHGQAVTPGLIDAHAHVLSTGLRDLYEIDLSHVGSVSGIVQAVAKRVASTPKGEWISGDGWDEGKLIERRYPTALDLDAVSPDNPVWLENGTGHYGVANTRALARAGVDAATPTPKAGTIERRPDGGPTGVLKETAAGLVTQLLPRPTPEQRRAALAYMLDHLHAEGMTGFKDPRISPEDYTAYLSMAREGRLTADVCVLFGTPTDLAGARVTLSSIKAAKQDLNTLPGTSLRVCGAKIFMDGSGAAPTAWMYQDWNHDRTEIALGNQGYPQIDPEIFRAEVNLFVAAGEGVGVHAIGDRAIDWVVDTYAEALKAHPRHGLRLSIIHANTPTDHAIAVMADLQKRYDAGIPESQAGFAWWLGDIYAANLGPARSARLNPFRTYERRGVIWAGGSDAPVTPIEARYGLWASTTRETAKATFGPTPFGTSETVGARSALKSYTVWAARQILADKRAGVLAVGKDATLAVWDRNPLTVPKADLKNMVCLMTLFRGQIVYQKSGTSLAP